MNPREEQREFEAIFDEGPAAQAIVVQPGTIVRASRRFEALFGYEPNELDGTSIERLVPDTARAEHPGQVAEYFASPSSRAMGAGRILWGVRKDGAHVQLEVGLGPATFEGGAAVVATVAEVPDRRQFGRHLESAFEAAPNGMLMIDQSRRIVLCNREIENIFGYDRTELLGAAIEKLVPDDVRGGHAAYVMEYLKAPERRAMGQGRDLYGRHRSGRLVPIEVGLQPVASAGETFVISSVVDISQRRARELELARKTEEVEEFAYRTSHDLRSPLKSIGGVTDCILEDLAEKNVDAAVAGVSQVKRLGKRLLTLVEDILALTKVDKDGAPVAPFDFVNYAERIEDMLGPELETNGVALERRIEHDAPLVVQGTRLAEILDNLVSNAIKYCDPNKEGRFVRIETLREGGRFWIRVADNGLGIPEKRQREVFGMFKRFHSGQAEGSGLGLYLVRKQAERIGATVKFTSSDEGTTFELAFDQATPDGSTSVDDPPGLTAGRTEPTRAAGR